MHQPHSTQWHIQNDKSPFVRSNMFSAYRNKVNKKKWNDILDKKENEQKKNYGIKTISEEIIFKNWCTAAASAINRWGDTIKIIIEKIWFELENNYASFILSLFLMINDVR